MIGFEKWWSSDAGAKLRDEAERVVADENETRRTELLAVREQVVKQAEKEIPTLAKVATEADTKRRAIEASLTAARNHANAARRRYGTASSQHDRRLAEIDQELRETAPPEIAQAIRRLKELRDALRDTPLAEESHEERNRVGFLRLVSTRDVANRRREMAAIEQALADCEALYFSPGDVTEALKAILATVPRLADVPAPVAA